MTTDLIHAPWTAAQVTALNAFQHYGRMHPFTCGAEHASGQSPVLVATNGGWVCPDPQCVYRQDWAHAFMAEPAGLAVGVGVSATPSHTGLRDRIRLAIARQYLDTVGSERTVDDLDDWEFGSFADAVLAVLAEQTDRAAIFRDLIAKAEEWDGHITVQELRRLADEAQQQREPSVHGESVAALAGLPDDESAVEVLRIVSDWCVEANENGGVDAGDLAWRLKQAGYPLPDGAQQ